MAGLTAKLPVVCIKAVCTQGGRPSTLFYKTLKKTCFFSLVTHPTLAKRESTIQTIIPATCFIHSTIIIHFPIFISYTPMPFKLQ